MTSVGGPVRGRVSRSTAQVTKQVAVLRTNDNTWGIRIRERTRLGITRNLSVFVLGDGNDRKSSDAIVELGCRRIEGQLVLMAKPIKHGVSIDISQPSAPTPFDQPTTLLGSSRPPRMQLAWDATISVSQQKGGEKESLGLIRLELSDDPGFNAARATLIERALAAATESRNRHAYHGTRRGPRLGGS